MGVVKKIDFGPVNPDALPEYPVGADVRLDSHTFYTWEFKRWLRSDMCWEGSWPCKGMFRDLVDMSHEETPVGTLPRDYKRLAGMLHPRVSPEEFRALCEQPYGPLHGWSPCRCEDGTVRLHHPVVQRVVLAALASRANKAAQTDAASRARKLQRLTSDVAQLSLTLAQDPKAVRWISDRIDAALDARGGARRTPEELHEAVMACHQEVMAGRMKLAASKA